MQALVVLAGLWTGGSQGQACSRKGLAPPHSHGLVSPSLVSLWGRSHNSDLGCCGLKSQQTGVACSGCL